MITAHKIRLSPTAAQAERIARQVGYARTAYNLALEHFKVCLDAGLLLGEADLRKWFNRFKDALVPWHNDREGKKKIHSEIGAKNSIKYGLGRAIKGFLEKRGGFPRFRARGRKGDSWRVSNGPEWVPTVHGRRVRLPCVGWVKMTEKLRFPEAVVLEATVTQRAGKWYISFTCEVADPVKPDLSGRSRVSIDRGERWLATAYWHATGKPEKIRNPRPLEHAQDKLRRAQKKLSRTEKGSNRRERLKRRVARLHYRVACIRRDNIHKATSAIARRAGRIVVEALDVAKMAKRRRKRNARGVYDAGMADFLRILKYKAERLGIEVVEVDPAYTSKTCSACGYINHALKSAEWWTCPQCGAEHHRDVNAAVVIGDKDVDCSAGSSPEMARGDPRLSSAPKAATRPPTGDKTLLFEAAGQPSMRKKREILNPIENARE